jgi:hypothetical protein
MFFYIKIDLGDKRLFEGAQQSSASHVYWDKRCFVKNDGLVELAFKPVPYPKGEVGEDVDIQC